MQKPLVFLIDNGSLRPLATVRLRELAGALSVRSGFVVEAVSLLHSHKIEASELSGVPATIVKRRLRQLASAGQRDFIFLPLFLGPSLAIKDYLPRVIDDVNKEYPGLSVRIAEVLSGADPDVPDRRLAMILAEQIRQLDADRATRIALVDHGTPIPEVNRVRNAVARQLKHELADEVAAVEACSMERRDGEAYAFNDPLLENLGTIPNFSGDRLILAMFFVLPGRHAGEGGDVAEIYEKLLSASIFKQVAVTPLIGSSPLLLEILYDRLRGVRDIG